MYADRILNAIEELKSIKLVPGYINTFAIVSSEETKIIGNAVCMNKLRSTELMSGDIEAIVSRVYTSYTEYGKECYGNGLGYNHPAFEQYVTWLLTDSPLSNCYLTESVEQIYRDKSFVLDAGAPANLMVMAGIAVRYTWEFPEFVENWAGLVDAGAEPSKALVLCQQFLVQGDTAKVGYGRLNSNHFIFPSHLCCDGVLDWGERCDDWIVNESYTVKRGYGGIQSTFHRLNKGNPLKNIMDDIVGLGNSIKVKTAFGSVNKTQSSADNIYARIKEGFNL